MNKLNFLIFFNDINKHEQICGNSAISYFKKQILHSSIKDKIAVLFIDKLITVIPRLEAPVPIRIPK